MIFVCGHHLTASIKHWIECRANQISTVTGRKGLLLLRTQRAARKFGWDHRARRFFMRVHVFTGSEASPFAQVFWKLRVFELLLTKLVS